MGEKEIWLNIAQVYGRHEPQASENTTQVCDIQPIMPSHPINNIFCSELAVLGKLTVIASGVSKLRPLVQITRQCRECE